MFKPVSPKLNVTEMEEGVLRHLEVARYLPQKHEHSAKAAGICFL